MAPTLPRRRTVDKLWMSRPLPVRPLLLRPTLLVVDLQELDDVLKLHDVVDHPDLQGCVTRSVSWVRQKL